jgi:hypothetical protein
VQRACDESLGPIPPKSLQEPARSSQSLEYCILNDLNGKTIHPNVYRPSQRLAAHWWRHFCSSAGRKPVTRSPRQPSGAPPDTRLRGSSNTGRLETIVYLQENAELRKRTTETFAASSEWTQLSLSGRTARSANLRVPPQTRGRPSKVDWPEFGQNLVRALVHVFLANFPRYASCPLVIPRLAPRYTREVILV